VGVCAEGPGTDQHREWRVIEDGRIPNRPLPRLSYAGGALESSGDTMGSSPGKYTLIWTHIDGGAVRFWNFDVDKHAVKPEHRTGLTQWVLPQLKMGGSARVVGLTSRTGSHEHNKRLSERRAAEVVRTMEALLGAKPKVLSTTGEGELVAETANARLEDSYWRAVTVFYWRRPEPPPEMRTVPPPVKRYATKGVFRPADQPVIGQDGSKGAAGGEALSRYNLAGKSEHSVSEEDPILVPFGFVVTRIEIWKERMRSKSELPAELARVAEAAEKAADVTSGEQLTYRFRWGPPTPGSVEVWSTESWPPDGKLKLKLKGRVTPARAMWIYEHPDIFQFKPGQGPN
jgi:hypothetical protein